MKTVTLADYRPSRRADGLTWTNARIEDSDDPGEEGSWSLVATRVLDPVDADPTALRSFTVQTDKAWLRLTFLDVAAGEDASIVVSTSAYPYRPTVAEIAETLRARTYSKGKADPDDPMQAVAGGVLVREFNDETGVQRDEVEKAITGACVDVAQATGALPGEMVPSARSVAVLMAAARLERSFIPDQAEENRSIFQTLRMSSQEALARLVSNAWIWQLANGGME